MATASSLTRSWNSHLPGWLSSATSNTPGNSASLALHSRTAASSAAVSSRLASSLNSIGVPPGPPNAEPKLTLSAPANCPAAARHSATIRSLGTERCSVLTSSAVTLPTWLPLETLLMPAWVRTLSSPTERRVSFRIGVPWSAYSLSSWRMAASMRRVASSVTRSGVPSG